MWRGSSLALGCEAAPKPDSPFYPYTSDAPNYADCVAEREQAPSPQGCSSRPTGHLTRENVDGTSEKSLRDFHVPCKTRPNITNSEPAPHC